MRVNELQKLIEGTGLLAELTFMHYKAFCDAGFSETQALILSSRIMEVTLLNAIKNNEEED